MTDLATAPAVFDRRRAAMLIVLLLAQAIIVWEQAPETWRTIAAWLGDDAQRAITNAFWVHLTPVAVTVSNLGLLVGAIGALLTTEPRRSRRWLLGAFALYLVLQVGVRLPPLAWSYHFPPSMQEDGKRLLATAAPLEAVGAVIDLLPLVLAFTIGATRAGMHQSRASTAPATGSMVVFLGSVQMALLMAIALAFVTPLMTDSWLVTGLLLLTMHYGLLTVLWLLLSRTGGAGQRWLWWLLRLVALVLALPGWCAVLYGLEAVEVMDRHLVAVGGRPGFIPMESLPMLAALFLGRSVASALAATDLLRHNDD